MSKNKFNLGGLVYSTNPDVKLSQEEEEEMVTLPPAQQKIKVRLDKKHRAGKAVTLIEGFVGAVVDQESLGKQLKAFCGTGGSVKDGEILVQGDNRDKVMQWLLKNGYAGSKKIN